MANIDMVVASRQAAMLTLYTGFLQLRNKLYDSCILQ